MAVELDLADIQGNILTAYGKHGFPKGRFMLFHIDRGDYAREIRDRIAADDHDGPALAIGPGNPDRQDRGGTS